MTPKEKAEELVNKFKDHVNPYIGSGMLSNTYDDKAILYQSKQCALICVDEMIAHNPIYPNTADWDECGGSHKYFYEAKMETAEKYWNKVIQEIEKL